MASNDPAARKTTNDRLTILEVKMDAAMDHMTKFADDTSIKLDQVSARLNKLDLNGQANKLRAIAAKADQLEAVAAVASDLVEQTKTLKQILPVIKELASADTEKKIAKKWIGKQFYWTNGKIARGASVAISGALSYVIIVQMGVGEAIIHWFGRVFGLS